MDRTASEDVTQGLQAQEAAGAGSSSMDAAALSGRQGTLGSGYFDTAGNWQTYDLDAVPEDTQDGVATEAAAEL